MIRMKLSKNTLDVLQNFATINQSLLFLPGKKQKTISPLMTVYAEVELDEEIEKEFSVYDLNMMLGLHSLFKEPEIELSDTSATFKEGQQKATLRYCNPTLISHPPKDKSMKPGEAVVSFSLDAEDIKSVLKAVALYGQGFVAISGDGENLSIKTMDIKQKESDGASYKVGETDKTFNYVIAVDNLKLLPHNFDVIITDKMKVAFKSRDMNLTYIVPCEAMHSTKAE